jgi:eukaryotic-like serine/threonine-protein kinase
MGEVWLAEQKEPVRRRVALKLVKGGLNTRETIARFNSERQALALMDHPAIAKVFDADATPTGAPYFVMEYVAGTPITDYCDHHRLSTRERLELFAHVCDGVQHAHQKAIIHRDLKPSNILVTEVDGKAAPKIIDFGVAKALTQSLGGETMFTRGRVRRNAGIHKPGASQFIGRRHRHPHRRLCARSYLLRVAGGRATARSGETRARGILAEAAGG